MTENKKKKKWARPKLIVLTRGKHEERVLDACKSFEVPTEAQTPNGTQHGCVSNDEAWCDWACEDWPAS